MDEIDMVRRFRREMAGPVEPARSVARAALLKRMQPQQRVGRQTHRLGPLRRRTISGAASVVLTAALCVLILSTLITGQGSANAAAVKVLRATARAAAAQPPPPSLEANEYVYTKSRGTYLDETSGANGKTWAVLVTTVRESWVAADGSGRIREVSGTPIFLSRLDRAAWQAAGSPAFGNGTQDTHYGPGQLSDPNHVDGLGIDELVRLSNDQAALAAQIRGAAGKAGNPQGYEMLVIVGDLLRETLVPPELRAALYEVAAGIPGITYVGRVVDSAGRTGVAVAASRSDLRYELIFDPHTSALLAEQETLLQPQSDIGAPAGTTVENAVYLQAGTVSSTAQTPAARIGHRR